MAIVYYTQQDEYDLVHSGQDCIGWTVVDQAGTPLGKVSEMLIDTETEKVDSILIDRKKRIPASDFALQNGRVVVRGILHDGEIEMGDAAATTAATTTATNESYAPVPKRTGEAKHVAGVTRAANDNEIVLPVIEEQLQVGKRTVESGAARVRTKIQEVPVEESVTLREEHVTVERHKVDRAITDADLAAVKDGTLEVTEKAEVPVVAKEARVVEEVVVGKNVTETEETVRDTVKRTEVDVDETNRTNDPNRQKR